MTTSYRTHAAWMDAFFAYYHAHRPVNATFIGVHDHDHRLPDFSESGVGDLLAETQALRRELDGIPVPDDPASAIDRRLAEGFLEIQEWELGSRHFHRGNPSLYTGEAVFGVIGLLLTEFQPLEKRLEAAIGRMEAVPDFLTQARRNVREAPAAWTGRAIRECEGAMALFGRGLPALAESEGLRSPAFDRAAEGAASAFSEHRASLESDLLPAGRRDVAAGEEALELHLRSGHALEHGSAEVAEYAESEMRKAQSEVRRGVLDRGAANLAEALERLRDLHPARDDYYAAYESCWQEMRQLAVDQSLVTWPDFPIRYVPRPEWVREAAPHLYFLFYRSPAATHRPPVHDYLVAPLPEGDSTDFLRANNDSVIKLNHVLHHGGLGHHVQNWHAFRAKSRIGRIAAVDCASRIAMFCGGTMAEGWACYATDLAAEFGALTPLQELAERHGRVRMAARAIVDVRLHTGEVTLDQAADFYRAEAGMTADAARGEAVKNSMFPGAALMYLMGTDAIHDLRAEMMSRSGSDFDLCAFHDEFLSWGSIPVSLIASEMRETSEDHD